MSVLGERGPLGRAATWFNFLVGAVGLWLLLMATLDWLQPEPRPLSWPLAVTFLCLFILARLLRFEIPPNITASLVVPLQIASVLLLGAVPTAWLVVPAFLAEVWKERPLRGLEGRRLRAMCGIIAFNLGMEALVTLAAGATWLALSGGGQLETTLSGLVALGITFLAFKAVNEALMIAGHWLRGVPVRDYLMGARTTVLIETLTMPMTALMVLIHPRADGGGLDETSFYIFLLGTLIAAMVVRGLTRARAELHRANANLKQANTDLERKVREVETLAEVGRAISADIEFESLLDTIYRRCTDILPANHFFIALYTEGESKLEVALEIARGERQENMEIPLGEGLTSHVILSRQPLLVRDLEAERPSLPNEPLVLDDRPNRSWMGAPMVARGEVVGAIVLQDPNASAYAEDDLRVLMAIAAQAAISVKNARLHQEAMHALRVEAENRELKRLNAKKSEFVNMVAHQFRTPLTAVIGYTNLLVDKLKKSPVDPGLPHLDRHLRTVHSESKRLSEMVEELLNLSRIRAGGLPLTMQRFDLEQLARETIDAHQLLAEQAGHPLVLETDAPTGEGGLGVQGDSSFIRQALANLVSNALKYAPPGTAVRVWARRGDGEAVVEVVDEGPGVPADDLDRVFDEFYRAAGPTADQPGTGLGLSICRGIIEAHGGRAWAERRGPGTAFCFALPLGESPSHGPSPSDRAAVRANG